jgi:excisionase family DNA binding protein
MGKSKVKKHGKAKKNGKLIAVAEEMMTPDEVAAYLRVDGVTLLNATLWGNIPSVNVGGVYRYSRRELKKWIRGKGEQSRKPILPPLEPWTAEKEAEVEAEIAEIYARRAADGTVGDWQDAQVTQ